MEPRNLERWDRLLSSIAAALTFAFFMTVVSFGWYQTFQLMAS